MGEKGIKVSEIQSILQINSKIEKIIAEKVNPKLEEHKGWIEFIEFNNSIIYVRFRGACSGCASNYETLDNLVKPILMENFNEIQDVDIVNDLSNEMIEFGRSLLNKK